MPTASFVTRTITTCPDGTQSNSYFRGDGYSLGSSYFFGDNRVGVGAVHYDSKYGIPR